jgi:hypothetical protein
MDDVLRKLDVAKTHPPVMLRKQVSGLLFYGNLPAGIVTSIRMRIQEFCKESMIR